MIMQRTALDIIRKRSFAMLLLAVAVGRFSNKLRAVQSFSIQGRLTRRFGFDVKLSFESNQPVRLISDLRRSIPSAFSSTRLLYTPTAWPENLYSEWTAEQDRLLWSYVKSNEKSAAELAVILGRGTRGVEKRIAKLKDVNSAAYRRLFVESTKQGADRENSDESRSSQTSKKLVPSHEVLRRIEWDYQLDETDFFVLHYDRVDNMIISSPLTAPNESINSGETSLIKALPEHRIMAIQYKDRVVWDRRNNRKVDRFFGAPGILSIIETYDNWKETRDKKKIQQSMLRQAWNARWIDIFGGSEQSHGILLQCTEKLLMPDRKESTNLQHNNFYETDPLIYTSTMTLTQDQQCQVDAYLETVQTLFHPLCRDPVNVNDEDTSSSVETDTPGLEKHEAILVSLFNELSEWIASPCWSSLESDDQTDYDDECNRQVEDISHQPGEEAFMREMILRKVASIMDQLEGKQSSAPLKSKKEKAREANRKNQQLKSLLTEEDLEETFVRGSGAGGQKINKTSNRVVLVHLPTNLRVECQETRSLSQNRKIARKRMIEKLDLHLNGNQSKQQTQQRKQTSKKRKTKAKNKARLAAKQEMKRLRKLQEKEASEENDDEYPF